MIDYCESSPCSNNATCVALVNAYACKCPLGFTGRMCETEINVCTAQSCLNGGTCRPISGQYAYRCECAAGFTGQYCEQNINECDTSVIQPPCLNGGVCVDGINGFTCQCLLGFTGAK